MRNEGAGASSSPLSTFSVHRSVAGPHELTLFPHSALIELLVRMTWFPVVFIRSLGEFEFGFDLAGFLLLPFSCQGLFLVL